MAMIIGDPIIAVTNTQVDSAISSTSVNPVQNKAIKAAIDLKLDKEDYYMYDIDANKTYLVTRSFVNGFLVEHFEEVTA